MTTSKRLQWDATGERNFETGLDRGVLYPVDASGTYPLGHAWNGLTGVSESPSGAEPNKNFANNSVYLTIMSTEEYACTIEAFTYPDEFAKCDGTASPTVGLSVHQQARSPFGLSFRTLIGDDILGQDKGYKLHLVYGGMASPSERSNATIGETPEAMTFSWEVSTTPVFIEGQDDLRPTAKLTIDSTKVDKTKLTALEVILYGSEEAAARLPLPGEIITLLSAGIGG